MLGVLAQAPLIARSLHIGPIGIAVGLFLYVFFLFLDGATRGHFRGTLLVVMGAAFVGTCVAISQPQ